jgi:predicted glycoside hydrolase/deacetylase ChbG (UPF0249 family)
MALRRWLIVNADDFGQSHGVNQGIIEAHERGIVTSASMMVRWPVAEEAAAYGRAEPSLSLGLHIDLGEWIFRDETWTPLYEVVPLQDSGAVAEEASHQLSTFRHLTGKDPTHMDSHQHVHLDEPARSVLLEVAAQLRVPLRHYSPRVRYRGDFYGQTSEGLRLPEAISVEALIELLASLPPGTTELSCHPGQGDDLCSMYRSERAQEVKALCDPRIRAALGAMAIELRSHAPPTLPGEQNDA